MKPKNQEDVKSNPWRWPGTSAYILSPPRAKGQQ